LTTDGTPYGIAMELDYAANTVTVYGPDGSVNVMSVTTGSLQTTFAPVFGVWQITGNINFTERVRWVSMGPVLADKLVSAGFAAPAGMVAPLYGNNFTRRTQFSFSLSGASASGGWFRVATGGAFGNPGILSGAAIGGRMRLSANDGRFNQNDWEFDCLATTQGTNSPTLTNRTGFAIAAIGESFNYAVDEARLSVTPSGACGLDLHVPAGVSSTNPVMVTGEFIGYFAAVTSPVIGATELENATTLTFANG
jgi:hypothetical protein